MQMSAAVRYSLMTPIACSWRDFSTAIVQPLPYSALSTIFRTGRLVTPSMPVISSTRPARPPQPSWRMRSTISRSCMSRCLKQARLERKITNMTNGDKSAPIVAVGWSSECFDGYNLALRLTALGYTKVYWYRGGHEAWEVNGLPEDKLIPQDW